MITLVGYVDIDLSFFDTGSNIFIYSFVFNFINLQHVYIH